MSRALGSLRPTGSSTVAIVDALGVALIRRLASAWSGYLVVGERLASSQLIACSPREFADLRCSRDSAAQESAAPCSQDAYKETIPVGDAATSAIDDIAEAERRAAWLLWRPSNTGSTLVAAARQRGMYIRFLAGSELPREIVMDMLRHYGILGPTDQVVQMHRDRVLARSPNATYYTTGDRVGQLLSGSERVLSGRTIREVSINSATSLELWMDEAAREHGVSCAAAAGASRTARIKHAAYPSYDSSFVSLVSGIVAPLVVHYVLWVLRQSLDLGVKSVVFTGARRHLLHDIAQVMERTLPVGERLTCHSADAITSGFDGAYTTADVLGGLEGRSDLSPPGVGYSLVTQTMVPSGPMVGGDSHQSLFGPADGEELYRAVCEVARILEDSSLVNDGYKSPLLLSVVKTFASEYAALMALGARGRWPELGPMESGIRKVLCRQATRTGSESCAAWASLGARGQRVDISNDARANRRPHRMQRREGIEATSRARTGPVPTGAFPKLLSVVIPVYNAADYLGDQLSALSQQRYGGDWEVVLADNGSTDGSLRVASAWKGSVPSLRIVDASDRRGAGHARNVGSLASAGDFLLYCDADDVVGSTWLSAMANGARKGHFIVALEDHTFTFGSVQRSRMPRCPVDTFRYLPWSLGGNIGVSRQAFVDVGGWSNDRPGAFAEDVDFCWRVQLAGYRMDCVTDALMHYRPAGSNRAMIRQQFRFGLHAPELYNKFVPYGAPGPSGIDVLSELWWIASRGVRVLTSRQRMQWLMSAAGRVGRCQGIARLYASRWRNVIHSRR